MSDAAANPVVRARDPVNDCVYNVCHIILLTKLPTALCGRGLLHYEIIPR